MITDLVLQMFWVIMEKFFGMFPIVETLPWGLDSIMVQAVGTFKGFSAIFPPINAIFNTFMLYLAFRLILLLAPVIPFFGKMFNPHKKA